MSDHAPHGRKETGNRFTPLCQVAELENILDRIQSIIKGERTYVQSSKPVCPARLSKRTAYKGLVHIQGETIVL
jgi:hypothetical protein